ncbi:MAG: hypothetical protein ACOVSR_04625 [Bacteroidia bacterium]
MKSKRVIVLFIALLIMVSCGKQVEQKVVKYKPILSEKQDSLTYNLDVELEILKKDKDFKNNPIYLVAITITNLSNDTFTISFDENNIDELFDFEPQLIEAFNIKPCDECGFEIGFLLKNQKAIFQTTIRDPDQFWYLNNLNNIKIGYRLKRVKVDNKLITLSKEKQQVYWSNYVNLNSTIPSYYFHNENIFFYDSIGNEAQNYFRYALSFNIDEYSNDYEEKIYKRLYQ